MLIGKPERGITFTVSSVTDSHVCIVEHVDFSHPDCPVARWNPAIAWAIFQRHIPIPEFVDRFGPLPNNIEGEKSVG